MQRAYRSLLSLNERSRPDSFCMAYRQGRQVSWGEFSHHIAQLSAVLKKDTATHYIIHTGCTLTFLVSSFAVNHAQKTAILYPNLNAENGEGLRALNPKVIGDPTLLCQFPVIDPNHIESDPAAEGTWALTNEAFIFHTSGSTGTPKSCYKQWEHLAHEVDDLEKKWGQEQGTRIVEASVSALHIYGALFRAFWPLCSGQVLSSETLFTPEAFASALSKGPLTVVSSPAFLKRILKSDNWTPAKYPPLIFSSGGVLEAPVAAGIHEKLGVWPFEILGSTETGGIAFRTQKDGQTWQRFELVRISLSQDGRLSVESPYIENEGPCETGDTIEWVKAPDLFILKPRADRVVKIEEKRISLEELEACLKEHPFVSTCITLKLEDRRQYIAAIVVLSEDGKQAFKKQSKLEVNRELLRHMAKYFEALICPKKWRYCDEIPTNTQGKYDQKTLSEVFKNDRI